MIPIQNPTRDPSGNPRPACRLYPRGLCHACYFDPEVRALYPAAGKNARGVVSPSVRRACVPTDAPPGTEAKILVLIDRAAAGRELWHRRDTPLGQSK